MGEAKVIKAVTEGVTKKVAAKEIKERTAKATGKTTKEITREPKVQRNYKDTVSRMLFREPENALSLYNALNGTGYTDASQITFNMLDNAIYMGMQNDISFLIMNEVNLYEHQSTYNLNMPLRDLFYVAELLQVYVKDQSLYSSKLIKLPTPHFVVFYNGVERIDQQEGKQPKFATGRPFFFTIGEIRTKKNFHLLVDVMKFLPEYDLYICGKDSFQYADEIRTQIKEKAVGNVFVTGMIEQTEKIWLYRNCQAFLFPSRGEGFGLPVIEAMQFGKAVFISNYTCLPEISNGFAFIWEKLEPEAMAKSIRKNLPLFYEQKEKIDQMKEHAYSFSYEKHIKAYIDLYHELLSAE